MKTSDFTIIDRTIEQHLTQDNIEKMANDLLNTFNDKMLEIKDSFLVTCFTQTFKNDNLWQTYAKNYTGFCIEYDLLKVEIETHDNLLFQISPMLYEKKASEFCGII